MYQETILFSSAIIFLSIFTHNFLPFRFSFLFTAVSYLPLRSWLTPSLEAYSTLLQSLSIVLHIIQGVQLCAIILFAGRRLSHSLSSMIFLFLTSTSLSLLLSYYLLWEWNDHGIIFLVLFIQLLVCIILTVSHDSGLITDASLTSLAILFQVRLAIVDPSPTSLIALGLIGCITIATLPMRLDAREDDMKDFESLQSFAKSTLGRLVMSVLTLVVFTDLALRKSGSTLLHPWWHFVEAQVLLACFIYRIVKEGGD